MIAQSLSISLPNNGCQKNCPYCVSKMTGFIETSNKFQRNLDKLVQFAETSHVTSVIITGKGEPLIEKNISNLQLICNRFKKYPLEVQTNGLWLINTDIEEKIKFLDYSLNIDVIALSFDNIGDFDKFKSLFPILKKHGFIIRITYNIVHDIDFEEIINLCQHHKIDQLSFREITIPNFGIVDTKESLETKKWILNNIPKTSSHNFIFLLKKILEDDGNKVRTLPYGVSIWDYKGIAVTYFDYCIQDNSNNDDIRSLIYREDGHLCTNWNSKASMIF